MAKCESCGVETSAGARYCSSCGARLGGKYEEFSVSADNLIKKVKELIHEGNVSRIIVKDEKGSVLIDMPVTAGVVGGVASVLLAPWLAALGVIAAIVTNCKVVVERR
jgi:hypothetical protein